MALLIEGGDAATVAVNFNQIDLWDKVINVRLVNADGTYDEILTPDPLYPMTDNGTARKPTIRLRGRLTGQNTLLNVELRVTNLYLAKPLSSYKSVQVTAGYRKDQQMGFSGTILVAFQELPGPDGVTCFQVLVGDVDQWTAPLTVNFGAGSLLSDVVGAIAQQVGLTPIYCAGPALQLPVAFQFNGMAKDALPELEDMFAAFDPQGNDTGVRLFPYGQFLMAYDADSGLTSQPVYRLDYITVARHNSAGYEIQAPWVPKLMPENILQIDPKFFRETFGGLVAGASGNRYRVIMIDFDFCTSDSTNMMSVVTVAAA